MDSKVRYGKEHGKNLIRISKKLIKNQELLKLLMNTDLDPLNPDKHPDQIDGLKLLHKNIRFTPILDTKDQTTTSKLVLFFEEGEVNGSNSDNENMSFVINVYCPFEEWIIAGEDLRPFAIMTKIRESIQDKRINGLGEIRYTGFHITALTEEMSCYSMRFFINAFN